MLQKDFASKIFFFYCGMDSPSVGLVVHFSFTLYDYKWVPLTTVWRFLRLLKEERPPVWRIPANILKKQSWTESKGWSSSVGAGRGANISMKNLTLFRNGHMRLEPGLKFDTTLELEKGHDIWYMEC